MDAGSIESVDDAAAGVSTAHTRHHTRAVEMIRYLSKFVPLLIVGTRDDPLSLERPHTLLRRCWLAHLDDERKDRDRQRRSADQAATRGREAQDHSRGTCVCLRYATKAEASVSRAMRGARGPPRRRVPQRRRLSLPLSFHPRARGEWCWVTDLLVSYPLR